VVGIGKSREKKRNRKDILSSIYPRQYFFHFIDNKLRLLRQMYRTETRAKKHT